MRMLMQDTFMNDFDRIVNALVTPTVATTVGYQPSCDIEENDDHYLVSFDVPGMKKEDIKIEVQNNRLTISGERQRRTSAQSEKRYGKFERSFSLPNTISTDKIEAHYEDGVLTVALPKAETAKPRMIQIQSDRGFLGKLLGTKKENSKEVDVKAC